MMRWPAASNWLAVPRWRLTGARRPVARCAPHPASSVGRRPILVVEDEPAIRALLVEFLRGEGYAVAVARDGQEALHLLEAAGPAERPGVVLLDMMLPRMDGAELLRQMRARGLTVPVVAMSASHEALSRALAAGARATVPKPFDLDRLLQTLQHQMAATA
jgi:CheY-like chemotaxis protein